MYPLGKKKRIKKRKTKAQVLIFSFHRPQTSNSLLQETLTNPKALLEHRILHFAEFLIEGFQHYGKPLLHCSSNYHLYYFDFELIPKQGFHRKVLFFMFWAT